MLLQVPADTLQLVVLAFFLASVYAAGVLSKRLVSPLVGWLLAGALLGPPLADFFGAPTSSTWPPVLSALGLLGVMSLTAEGGLRADLATLRNKGLVALGIAVTGIVGTLALAMALLLAFGFEARVSLVAGAALAPTSLGFAVQLLKERGLLAGETGQLIMVAAVLDDVISLVLAGAVSSLSGSHSPSGSQVDVAVYVVPIVSSVAIVLVLGGVALFVCPRVARPFNERVLTFLVLALSIGLGVVTSTLGSSFLLGAFLAGLLFNSFRADQQCHAWDTHVQSVQDWCVRLFFAATVGFLVPLDAMFTMPAFLRGLALTGAAVLGKIVCGVFQGGSMMIAASMVGRGEYSFLIATSLRSQNELLYASVVWALVLASLMAPFLFRGALMLEARSSTVDAQFESTSVPL